MTIRRQDSLDYHAGERPGKIEVRPVKACVSPREMRMAYLPGAAHPAQAITEDPAAAWRYTARGNLVGVVTNGSAVPGLGDVGPLAAKPMLEGVGVLLKRLADLDVFDLELDERDPDELVATIRRLAPTFGAISLKDIAAPTGLEVHERLAAELPIPVLHENLSGTALVAAAALVNALDLADKAIGEVRVVVSGAGTVGLGCAQLFTALGVARERLALYDVTGLVHPGRDDLDRFARAFARDDAAPGLVEALEGADVFVGASVGGVLDQEMVRSMAAFPIVLALASPEPEIRYEEARAARRDVLVATSDPAHPNAIVDLLGFPYVLRGALDVGARHITSGMLLAAARALAELAREDVVEEVSRAYGHASFSFGPEYLVPRPVDPRILPVASAAVAEAAVAEGIAERALELTSYRETLSVRLGTGRETLRRLVLAARRQPRRVVFPEGASETLIRAARVLVDEGIASPILVGEEESLRSSYERLGLDASGIAFEEPRRSPRAEVFAEALHRRRQRHGLTLEGARARAARPEFHAALMVAEGDADMIVCGPRPEYAEPLRTLLEVLGTAEGVRRLASCHLVLLPRRTLLLADCAVNIEPSAEELAEIALMTAARARALGRTPRVALLSFSNFGAVEHRDARKVAAAARLAREQDPELSIDGEMQLSVAIDAGRRERLYPFSELSGEANVLVFPSLSASNIALETLSELGDAVIVGPLLMGCAHPAQLLHHGASVEDVVNLVALGIAAGR